MKKSVCISLATITLILLNCFSAFANPAGYGRRGGYSGGSGGSSGGSGGYYGGRGGYYGGHGGYYGGHGGYYGGHGGYYGGHGGSYGVGIWLGPGWWGSYYPYYPYYPYYSYYPYYPYYVEPPVAVPQQHLEEYVQPQPQENEPSYWYYCKDPQGYYPYVKQCPQGWIRVVPSPPQPPDVKK